MDPKIFDTFRKKCPLIYRALYGRRYLLPRKLQSCYANQDHGLGRRTITLLGSLIGGEDSFPRKAELICLLGALKYDLPLLYLDPDLAEAPARTDLPPDFSTTDCKFPWGGFRLMIPLNLDLDTEARALQYSVLCLCKRGERIGLDERFLSELRSLGNVTGDLSRGFTHPTPQFYASGLTVSGDQRVTFAHAWENETLRELARTDTRPTSEPVRDLLFNTLILLSQYPARFN